MSDIIDINVGETIEEVTINVVDNLITVNINKVTGGGGSQTLAETLVIKSSKPSTVVHTTETAEPTYIRYTPNPDAPGFVPY